MNYCFSSVGSWKGNASQVRPRELGTELLKLGHRVSYILDDEPYNRNEVILPEGSESRFVETITGFAQFTARQQVIHALNPDYFHVLNPSPKSLLTCRGLNKKIRIVADYDEWAARRENRWSRKMLFAYIDSWFRRNSALICVSSKYMQEQFAKEFVAKAVYLPYATYLNGKMDVDNPYSAPTFVYVGALFPAYDHDIIFHAAIELRKRGLNPAIELLGTGPEFDQWKTFALQNQLSNIIMRGYVSNEELWQRVLHSNVLLFPIRPTFGNLSRCPSKTYLYAQAHRPIITCDVSEVPQTLGPNAIYVEPTAAAFADAISARMHDIQPPVDYGIERHNWTVRAQTLLTALSAATEAA